MFLILLLYLLWAIFLFVNKAVVLHCSHPFYTGGLCSLFSGILLVAYSYFIQGRSIRFKNFSREEWKKYLLSSFMLYGIAITGFALGIGYLNPIVISFVYSSAPFLTAGLVYFLHGEVLSKNKLFGLFIGFIGILAIVLSGDEAVTISSSISGTVIYLVAMLLFSYSWILFKDIIKTRKKDSLLLNGISMIIGGFTAFICSVSFKVPDESMKLLFTEHGLLFTGFFILNAFCYGLYSYLLTKYSATFLSFSGFLDPIFGVLIGVLVFGQPFYLVFIFSFIALFVGLYIFYQEELKLSEL